MDRTKLIELAVKLIQSGHYRDKNDSPILVLNQSNITLVFKELLSVYNS